MILASSSNVECLRIVPDLNATAGSSENDRSDSVDFAVADPDKSGPCLGVRSHQLCRRPLNPVRYDVRPCPDEWPIMGGREPEIMDASIGSGSYAALMTHDRWAVWGRRLRER
jgi:hypothetical protein